MKQDLFTTHVRIHAEPAQVWHALTDPDSMVQWLGEPGMQLKVKTDWTINTPIFIRGFHHGEFENKGVVLAYDTAKRVSYSHFSSVSQLVDTTENYSIFEFTLTSIDKHTLVTLTIQNFPTETIRKHLEFYWKTTLVTLKNHVENVRGYLVLRLQ